ncbi:MULTISPECIES: ABC transporter ATP-binding protein [Romboutsia]|uniref:Nod factor export ATP-binding protein I n=1 Tax=Romboutsia hominis TaxID=1507512 RepID=A0A2P2BQ31_9FIRM|nr:MULTISPECIES: ABC transporter ATP-binding protein [Romboutsia]MCH1959784.1 ABC transporter ATP-binding protein [Romboutsia hominis]MCH1969792.1 ABC transporter ATP-binding protein [Romboutsia hominis]MDB8803721.1 ABC transporter ATP-binding protein [Romboutsia sp. 1001216sp1]MDB8806929.1 ABC transporter ATP-binding protein [Romboutsia sp. 1001216sp1]MDB8809368.1 ABC transporter ATP-binding protein [Romboutsia sp. 1001216sp1]
MNIVEVSNISKKLSKSIILDDLSLDIKKGEIVGLIGPSGAGKTTFVKAIIGMEKIDSGFIKVFNKPIPNLDVLQNIGYMAQSDALYEDLSAKENLDFFGKIFGLNKSKIKERIDYTSKLVNLENHLSKKVKSFSGGMKRRLSLAISLIQDPALLILDEPTVGIDPRLRFDIWNELYNLKNEGKSIIVTTHVMDEAVKCDRLALIRDGKIIATGTPNNLIKEFEVNTIEEIFLKLGGETK